MEYFSSQSPLVFTNSEWADSSKEEFVTEAAVETLSYSAEEIGGSVQPTLQLSVLRITSTKTEETKDNSGTAEATTQRPRDEWSVRSTISIELTSLTDIMKTESTIKDDPQLETTQSYIHAITQQGHDVAQDSTPIHADFSFVSQKQSRDTDESVTLSSISDVTSKLVFSVSEKPTPSSTTITSTDSTSKASEPTSDDSNLRMSSSAAVAVDGVRSSADSQSRLNDTSSAGVTFFGLSLSLDSTTTAYTKAIAHESSKADNKTSSTQVPSDDDPVSTQYNNHTFISTSTLDAKISEHPVSTDTQEDTVLIGTFSQYAWKTREAENTFQSGSTSSSADRLSRSSEKPPESEGPGTSAVTGYAIGASVAGLVLIAILCVVVIVYRRRRRKSCDIADQDLKDYRSLMKIPSRSQTNDGFTAPYGGFPYSPFAEPEDGSSSSFSATNFRARFDHEPNGTSTQKNGFESEKEIPLQELCEPPSAAAAAAAAGYSEAFSVDTFRPGRQITADTQSEATNVV